MDILVTDRPTQAEAPPVRRAAKQAWLPGTHRLRDAWFPIAFSSGITDRPSRRLIHSEPYFVWRERGALRVARFHPAHAPARARGSVFTDEAGDYPALERYGYVWAWYGDPQNARPELMPHVPYLPEAGGLPWWTQHTIRFDCSSDLSLENLIDLTHADFLHANVVGDEKSDSDEIEVLSDSETVTMIRTCTGKSVAPIMRLIGGVRARTQEVRAVIHIHVRSGVALAYGRYRPGFDVPLFHPCVPESGLRCRLNATMNTTRAPGLFKYAMPLSSYIISRQDNLMVRPQAPRYLEPDPRPDCHSRFDSADTRYRFLKQQLADRQAAGDFAYSDDALPSRDVRPLLGIT